MVKNIVVLYGAVPGPGGTSSLAGESSVLDTILEHSATKVSVITLGLDRPFIGVVNHVNLEHQPPGIVDRTSEMVGLFALRSRLSTFPIGRLLNSMGPVAQARVFWRAVRRNPDAREALRAADIAIATDLEAVKTAWIALHRRWVSEAHYDHRASGFGA